MKHSTFGCDQHDEIAPHTKHMDADMVNEGKLPEHKRGVGLPAKHSAGKHASQLNPDHGPHHMHHHSHGGPGALETVHHRKG